MINYSYLNPASRSQVKSRKEMSIQNLSEIKIIGHDDLVGVYELSEMWQGGTNEASVKMDGLAHSKYEIEKGKEAAMRFSLISKQFKYLLGEVLTVLEATVDNDRKLQAIKSITKDKFHARINWIYEQCGTPEEEQEYLGFNGEYEERA